MNFDGAGGLVVSERAGVHSAEVKSSTGTHAEHAPRVALLTQLEGCFQITYIITTPRFYVPNKVEATYVHMMSRYLAGTAEDLVSPPVSLIVNVAPLMRVAKGSLDSAKRSYM